MKENKSKRSRFRAFVQSTNFLFIVSIVISLVIWIYMSISTGNDTSLTISDIPVQVELSEDAVNNGLQVFRAVIIKPHLRLQVTELLWVRYRRLILPSKQLPTMLILRAIIHCILMPQRMTLTAIFRFHLR